MVRNLQLENKHLSSATGDEASTLTSMSIILSESASCKSLKGYYILLFVKRLYDGDDTVGCVHLLFKFSSPSKSFINLIISVLLIIVDSIKFFCKVIKF